MIGREILNYIIESKIGEGGMATVYKARHKTLRETWRAIKVLHPALALDPGIKAKFITEAQTMATLSHPAIVKVYDYAEEGNDLFLIMEYVEGQPLDYLLKNVTGPLPEPRLKKLFSALLDGFAYAHGKGIVHRDIKPSNLIITQADEPKIIDFGIVKIMEQSGNLTATKAGTKIGTPAFMSPEQILARGVDKRSDIYALGITLFHMVTGRAPFDTNTLSEFEIQQKIVTEPLPRARAYYPAVSNQIQAVIDKATQKKKEDRFQDCTEFRQELFNDAFGSPGIVGGAVIHSFTADTTSIRQGGSTVLRWKVSGVESCLITGLGITKNLDSSATVTPALAATYTLRAGTAQQSVHIAITQKKPPVKAIIGVAAAMLLTGLIVLAANKNSDTVTSPPTADTAVTQPPAEPEMGRIVAPQPDRQPVTVQNQPEMPPPAETEYESSTAVSPYDKQMVNNVISERTRSFDGSLTDAMLQEICNGYSYPVQRYFNDYNKDYDYIRTANINYFTKSIRQGRWVVDNNNSAFQKNRDGTFDVDVYGDYYFYYQYTSTKHDPEHQNHLYLHNRYKLDGNYKIVEEYEVTRSKLE